MGERQQRHVDVGRMQQVGGLLMRGGKGEEGRQQRDGGQGL